MRIGWRFLRRQRGGFGQRHVGHDALRVGGRTQVVRVPERHGVAHFMGPDHPLGQGVAKEAAVQVDQRLAQGHGAAADEAAQGHLGAAALGNGVDQHQPQAAGLAGHGAVHGGVVGHAQAGLALHPAQQFKTHADALGLQFTADLVQALAHALRAVARQAGLLAPPDLHRHRALGRRDAHAAGRRAWRGALLHLNLGGFAAGQAGAQQPRQPMKD